MENNRSIAICLATFNGQCYIQELLDSLDAQNVDKLSLYIRDDGSTDQTLQIIMRYREQTRHNVTILADDLGNLGPSRNFRNILSFASEDIIFFCDQDDVWHPEKVSRLVEATISGEDGSTGVLAFCNYTVVDESCNHLDFVDIDFSPHQVIYENQIPGCCIAINRPLLEGVLKVEGADVLHDWLSILVNLSLSGRFIHVNKSMVSYRQHSSNVVGIKQNLGFFDRIKGLRGFITSSYNVYIINKSFYHLRHKGFIIFLALRFIHNVKKNMIFGKTSHDGN